MQLVLVNFKFIQSRHCPQPFFPRMETVLIMSHSILPLIGLPQYSNLNPNQSHSSYLSK